MIAEIIAVGSEMLTPFRQDTNSLYITGGLNELGVTVGFKTIVGDNFEHLTGAVRIALARADLAILSGGLGPTEDDRTREAVGEALGLGAHSEPGVIAALEKRFAERGIPMLENNRKQAEILDGAEMLWNANGSAPGQMLVVEHEGRTRVVVLLPGPPRELKPLFDEEVKARLRKLLPPCFLARRQLRMALIPESVVDARTAPIYKTYPDVETTILASGGEIALHFAAEGASLEEARARVDEVAARVQAEMGEDVFSAQGESLEETVLLLLGMRHQTLACAESCTGGLLAERLTAVPNSSEVFVGGVVAYSAATKTALCDVPAEMMEAEGTVSGPVAQALAEGIRRRTGAGCGVGITGLAGPGGGPPGPDAGRPVGLVYIALAMGNETEVKELHLGGDRERIRWWATQHALEMIRRRLL